MKGRHGTQSKMKSISRNPIQCPLWRPSLTTCFQEELSLIQLNVTHILRPKEILLHKTGFYPMSIYSGELCNNRIFQKLWKDG